MFKLTISAHANNISNSRSGTCARKLKQNQLDRDDDKTHPNCVHEKKINTKKKSHENTNYLRLELSSSTDANVSDVSDVLPMDDV